MSQVAIHPRIQAKIQEGIRVNTIIRIHNGITMKAPRKPLLADFMIWGSFGGGVYLDHMTVGPFPALQAVRS